MSLKIATFNVENLLSRARLLNFQDNEDAADLLDKVGQLGNELKKAVYNKPAILALYQELSEYIEIVEVREKLLDRSKKKVVADGADGWGGFISFKRDRFSEPARKNTAKVIRAIDADVCCLVEVESRVALKHFCTERLATSGSFQKYPYNMLVDGNDDRDIDVGLVSRLPIGQMKSHIFDTDAKGEIFSRDCLEIEVKHPVLGSIWFLLNHFKSKGYGNQAESGDKRTRQAQRVSEILAGYDLTKQNVVVCGDFNDTSSSQPLSPLLHVQGLYDVLAEKFPNPADRWTYHYKTNEQIDFLLVSRPLKDRLRFAGVERRGIFGADTYTNGAIRPFDTVTTYRESASDHGAVWAEFEVQ